MVLLASLRIEQQQQPGLWLSMRQAFTCGIFFCAAVPFRLNWPVAGPFQYFHLAVDGNVIKILTKHIWSNNYRACPGMMRYLALSCEPSLRSEHADDLGYDVSRFHSDESESGATCAIIRHTIEMAK